MSGNLVISVALFAASERDVLRVQAGGVTAMGRGSVCYPRPTTSVNGRFGELEDFCGIPQIGTAERRHRCALASVGCETGSCCSGPGPVPGSKTGIRAG